MKVLIATTKPFAKVAVDGIRKEIEAAGFELLLLEKYTNKQELIDAVTDVNAIIVRSDSVDAEVIAAAPNLKIIVRAGAGYDNVDLKAASEADICVMNTPGQNSNAVAELVFGLMVFVMRDMFQKGTGSELKGKNLGIHAYGNVGTNVARVAKGFGMNVLAYDAYCCQQKMKTEGVTPVLSVEELYKKSDVISLHIPFTPETFKLINKDLLSNMPENAVLINTARKEVIDEKSILEFMKERTDFKYVSDIRPDNHDAMMELFEDRYFSTPKKMGAQTKEANINAGIAAAQQIVGFLKNGDRTYQVN